MDIASLLEAELTNCAPPSWLQRPGETGSVKLPSARRALENKERRCLILLQEEITGDGVHVINAEPAANRRLAILEWIPCESQTGFEIAQCGVRIVGANAGASGSWLSRNRCRELHPANWSSVRDGRQIGDPALSIF